MVDMSDTKHFKTILVSNFATTAALKKEGPRGDFTCKQQPLRSCKRRQLSKGMPVTVNN
jgi:hypothetical protein